MTVLIDADGCPVVDLTVNIAVSQKIECIIICDTSHIFEKFGAKTITVSKGNDSVDFALVNMVKSGDIVVTQDYGLAAMCLARRAIPINQNGRIYTNDNIDALLNERHTSKKIRMAGGRSKNIPKRTPEQDLSFKNTLMKLLQT